MFLFRDIFKILDPIFEKKMEKSQIYVPHEVKDYLFFESSQVIRSTRAECKATYIKYDPKLRQLVFGGSVEKKQKAMIVMYEKFEKMGLKYNRFVDKNWIN